MAMAVRWWWCVLAAILSLSPSFTTSSSIVNRLPGFDGDLPFKLETGYIEVGDVEVFYYFVESQRSPSTDPLLLWLVGGPGCSGLNAFFMETGPVSFNFSHSLANPKLTVNPYAWTQELNMIYVDLPAGTGFSYSKTQEGYHPSDAKWVEQAYGFLKKWFVDHPKFETNPFYIGGGSYSAIPIAPLVQKVYEGYKVGDKPVMNIKGYVLASPSAQKKKEVNDRVAYAYMTGIVSEELYESMRANCNGDYVDIDPRNTNCVSDYNAYHELLRYVYSKFIYAPVCMTASKETRRVLLKGSQTILQSLQEKLTRYCIDDSHMFDAWANDRAARNALHIKEGTKEKFEACNESLAYTYDLSNVVNYHQSLTNTNLRALIYNGDMDLTLPLFSTRNWIADLNLSIYDRWRPWSALDEATGYTQTYSKNGKFYLTFATVKEAGHVAQYAKPREVYIMIKRWFDFSPI